jgi:3-hydroxyisobutyrate dehydrogenase-like beta-hydroxyacid dehydrogenase
MIDAGLPVALWARRPETLEAFADSAAELFSDIEDFARRIDYLGICVVDDNDVKSVCERVIPQLQPGSTLVIHSTVSPTLCQTLAAQAAGCGLSLLDAPVSGGSPAAEAGTLTVMVGGDAAVLEKVRPVLETFSALIVHLGAVGAGQHAKLINNSLMAANMGLALCALQAADVLALARQPFIELIKASSGRSFGFEVCSRLPRPSAFEHGARLLAKDVALLGDAILGDESTASDSFTVIESASRAFLDPALEPDAASAGRH